WSGALRGDEVGEPPHLALHGLDGVALQLTDVAVGAGRSPVGAGPVEPLLETRAASLEDPQPHLGVGAGEESEPHVEVLVLPRGGTDVGDLAGEVLRAGRSDLVDDPLPPGDSRGDGG